MMPVGLKDPGKRRWRLTESLSSESGPSGRIRTIMFVLAAGAKVLPEEISCACVSCG
jgi:hypothetical protein